MASRQELVLTLSTIAFFVALPMALATGKLSVTTNLPTGVLGSARVAAAVAFPGAAEPPTVNGAGGSAPFSDPPSERPRPDSIVNILTRVGPLVGIVLFLVLVVRFFRWGDDCHVPGSGADGDRGAKNGAAVVQSRDDDAKGAHEMFGTIALMRPKAGREADVVRHFDSWWSERAPKAAGAIAGDVRRNDGNPAELIATVTFESREHYVANANDADQDRWYRQLVELLETEPRWIDGEVISRHSL